MLFRHAMKHESQRDEPLVARQLTVNGNMIAFFTKGYRLFLFFIA